LTVRHGLLARRADCVRVLATGLIARLDRGRHIVGRGDHHANGQTRRALARDRRLLVGWVVGRNIQRHASIACSLQVHRDHSVALGDLVGNHRQQLVGEPDMLERDPGHAQVIRKELSEQRATDQAFVHQRNRQPCVALVMGRKELLDRLRGQDPGPDKEFS
jgi:hypothetical protein